MGLLLQLLQCLITWLPLSLPKLRLVHRAHRGRGHQRQCCRESEAGQWRNAFLIQLQSHIVARTREAAASRVSRLVVVAIVLEWSSSQITLPAMQKVMVVKFLHAPRDQDFLSICGSKLVTRILSPHLIPRMPLRSSLTKFKFSFYES